jgi:hypothetical protein
MYTAGGATLARRESGTSNSPPQAQYKVCIHTGRVGTRISQNNYSNPTHEFWILQ